VDKFVPFVSVSSFQKRSDFGQIGDSEVDYRLFARWEGNPASLRSEAEAASAAAASERKAAEAEAPAPDAGEFQKRKHERRMAAVAKKEADARLLVRSAEVFARGDAWVVMPLYPYGPADLRLDLRGNPPNAPSVEQGVPLGTDQSGRDVVPLLLYGFRLSLAFALVVTAIGEAFGILVGGIQGYWGGWVDIASQRFVEIWGSIPFLFVMMILASMVTPTFLILAVMLTVLRSWIAITFYVRGEFYREKSKDYVQAAIGTGVSDWKIITKHILPNSIVPIVTFTPFALVGYIGALVSLDYLGFGLPPGTPSWGALLRQGLENVKEYPHLTVVPTLALAGTLYAVVMIGEAVREAFDPKVFSRLR
jgi:microcin C transport system permease protein